MGLGSGHVLDMINRLKQNRAQRPSNRSKFKENNRDSIYSSDKKSRRPNFKTVSEKELTEIKNQIRARAKTDRKKEKVTSAILLFVLALCLVAILRWI